MTTTPWMPLYIADYLADTRRLSTLEHGAYMLLIFEYWRNGRLPDDDKRLSRIVGLTEAGWAEIRDSIAEFFEDGWRHKRIEAELAKAASKSETARASAEKRWRKSQGVADPDASEMQTHVQSQCEGNALGMLSQPQPESQYLASLNMGERASALPDPTPLKPRQARMRARSGIAADAQPSDADRRAASEEGLSPTEFRATWAAFRDHHLAKGSAMADWPAAWRTWLRNRQRFARDRQSPRQPSLSPLSAAALRHLSEEAINGSSHEPFASTTDTYAGNDQFGSCGRSGYDRSFDIRPVDPEGDGTIRIDASNLGGEACRDSRLASSCEWLGDHEGHQHLELSAIGTPLVA